MAQWSTLQFHSQSTQNAVWFNGYGTAYFCFKAQSNWFFSTQIIDTKKSIEEKEKDLVKMRIQGQQFFSFLFVPIVDFCLFVANQKLVKSNPSMNVSKTRKRESKTLTCVRVCVRVFV